MIKTVIQIVIPYAFFVLITLSCNSVNEEVKIAKFEPISAEKSKPIISYEVLRKWENINPGRRTNENVSPGVGLEILVSPKSSKKEVMALAKRLYDMTTKNQHDRIVIYDNKHAWEIRDCNGFPTAKYMKHCLVYAQWNFYTNKHEMNWLARGRKH